MTRRIDNVIEAKGALILGAGVAGLFTALKLAPFPTLVLAGTRPGVSGSSAWAQGGIAAAMDPTDSWRFHAEDTMAAGAGICDPEVAEFVAREAAARIEDLIAYGAPFDRKPDGSLALGREAAHSANRIVHVKGDRAGAEVTRTLAERALATAVDHLARRLSRARTGDGRRTCHRPLRALRRGAACAPRSFPRARRHLRDGRAWRTLCRDDQPARSTRRRSGHGGTRGRNNRRSRIRPVSSHRHRHRPRSCAACDGSVARRRRDPCR